MAELTNTPFLPLGKQMGSERMHLVIAQSVTMAQGEPLFLYVRGECFAMKARQEGSHSH